MTSDLIPWDSKFTVCGVSVTNTYHHYSMNTFLLSGMFGKGEAQAMILTGFVIEQSILVLEDLH